MFSNNFPILFWFIILCGLISVITTASFFVWLILGFFFPVKFLTVFQLTTIAAAFLFVVRVSTQLSD